MSIGIGALVISATEGLATTGASFAGILALIGGAVLGFLGGWDVALEFLLLFMLLDIITGCLTSLLYGNSCHTKSGHYSSKVFARGLGKKVMMLAVVMLAFGIDHVLAIEYLRDAVVLFFIFNEAMSILENAECMGLPIPGQLRKALDIYYDRAENDEEKKNEQHQ